MTTTTVQAPGTFSWFELATTDQDAAKRFYGALFNYEIFDSPIGPDEVYTLLKLQGRDAGALFKMSEKNYPPGTPPHWMPYLSVESADQTAEKVKAAGGKVMAEPFDVMEHGRMAVCMDPLGAAFCVWQAKQHSGVAVRGEPGAFAWCQLNAPSTGREEAKRFYGEVFGWTYRDDPMAMGDSYTTWLGQEGGTGQSQVRGGMMPIPPGVQAPAHWLIYFASDDVDESAARARLSGGQIMVPGTDIPGMGRFAVLQDPQGAFFAVVKFAKPVA